MGEAAKRDVGTGENQIPDMAAFASSLSSTGFQKLPSGLIIQWGIVSGASNYTVTYPVTFPSHLVSCLLCLPQKFLARLTKHTQSQLIVTLPM
ncbi:gp53-like domain-containing protein [Escherichia sp. R-CC3]